MQPCAVNPGVQYHIRTLDRGCILRGCVRRECQVKVGGLVESTRGGRATVSSIDPVGPDHVANETKIVNRGGLSDKDKGTDMRSKRQYIRH